MKKHENFTVSDELIKASLKLDTVLSKYGVTMVKNDIIYKVPNFLKTPIRTEGLIFAFCTNGKAIMQSDFKQIELHKNSVAVIYPRTITCIESEEDLEVTAFIINEELIQSGSFSLQITVKMMIEILSVQLISLDENDVNQLRRVIEIMENIMNEPESDISREKILYSIGLFICILKDAATKFTNKNSIKLNEKVSRKNEIFKKFLTIASSSYLTERSIDFYAEKLCISPKYLSAVSKESSGYTVMDWINRFIIMEAKSMLKYSDMSVMEISDHLNFSTPSAFGKYFKKNTGLTPGDYRNSSVV